MKVSCKRVWYGWQNWSKKPLIYNHEAEFMHDSSYGGIRSFYNNRWLTKRLTVKLRNTKYPIKKHVLTGHTCKFIGSYIVIWNVSISISVSSWPLKNYWPAFLGFPTNSYRYCYTMRANCFLLAYIDFMFVGRQFEVKERLKDTGSTYCWRFAPIGEDGKKFVFIYHLLSCFCWVLLWFGLLVELFNKIAGWY